MKLKFEPKLAEKLLAKCESLFDSEETAALHLSACLAALLPDRELALKVVNHVFDEADKDAA